MLEKIFHSTRKLNSDYSSQRQSNCAARVRENVKVNHRRGTPYLNQNHEFRTQSWDLDIENKLLQQHQLQSNHKLNPESFRKQRQEKESNQIDMENISPQTYIKNREDVMVSEKHQKTKKFSFDESSENKRKTYLMITAFMSKNNGHKFGLDSNFVLSLS